MTPGSPGFTPATGRPAFRACRPSQSHPTPPESGDQAQPSDPPQAPHPRLGHPARPGTPPDQSHPTPPGHHTCGSTSRPCRITIRLSRLSPGTARGSVSASPERGISGLNLGPGRAQSPANPQPHPRGSGPTAAGRATHGGSTTAVPLEPPARRPVPVRSPHRASSAHPSLPGRQHLSSAWLGPPRRLTSPYLSTARSARTTESSSPATTPGVLPRHSASSRRPSGRSQAPDPSPAAPQPVQPRSRSTCHPGPAPQAPWPNSQTLGTVAHVQSCPARQKDTATNPSRRPP